MRFLRLVAAATLLGVAKAVEKTADLVDEIKSGDWLPEVPVEPEEPVGGSTQEYVEYYAHLSRFWEANNRLNPYLLNRTRKVAELASEITALPTEEDQEKKLAEAKEMADYVRYCISCQ